MKLKNLNDKLQPIDLGDPLPEEAYNQLTYKKLYRLILATGKSVSDVEAVDALDLSIRFASAEEEIELSATEFGLLERKVKANPTGLVDHFWGQLLRNLKG